MIEKFIPNEFEFRILCFLHGQLSNVDLMKIFLDTRLFFPSTMKDRNDHPNFISAIKSNELRLTVFTSKRLLYFSAMLLKANEGDIAINSYFEITGREILNILPKKHGLMINTDLYIGFSIPYYAVKRWKKLKV